MKSPKSPKRLHARNVASWESIVSYGTPLLLRCSAPHIAPHPTPQLAESNEPCKKGAFLIEVVR